MGRPTILLIDGNEELREAVDELLTAMSYEVLTATRREQALQLFDNEPVDVVLADAAAPGPSGLELVRELLSRRGDLPVVLMSSSAASAGDAHADGGHLCFLRKPFSAHELEGAIAISLAGRGRGAAAILGPRRPESPPAAVQPRRPFAAWGLAAAALIVVLGGFLARSSLFAPPLPEPPSTTATRASIVDLIGPLGEIQQAPAELVWHENTAASSYRIQLLGVDGRVLWEAAVAGPRHALPDEVATRLDRGVVYYWRVEALAGDRVIARSPAATFRIAPGSRPNGSAKED